MYVGTIRVRLKVPSLPMSVTDTLTSVYIFFTDGTTCTEIRPFHLWVLKITALAAEFMYLGKRKNDSDSDQWKKQDHVSAYVISTIGSYVGM